MGMTIERKEFPSVMAHLALEQRPLRLDPRDVAMRAAEFRGGFKNHEWRLP
jgi:hypothetical protein